MPTSPSRCWKCQHWGPTLRSNTVPSGVIVRCKCHEEDNVCVSSSLGGELSVLSPENLARGEILLNIPGGEEAFQAVMVPSLMLSPTGLSARGHRAY